MLVNEKIKASEVQLTGLQGEDLGILPTKEALRMAKELKVDLVCLSLAVSPPLCKLASRSDYLAERDQEKKKDRTEEKPKEPRSKKFGSPLRSRNMITTPRNGRPNASCWLATPFN